MLNKQHFEEECWQHWALVVFSTIPLFPVHKESLCLILCLIKRQSGLQSQLSLPKSLANPVKNLALLPKASPRLTQRHKTLLFPVKTSHEVAEP